MYLRAGSDSGREKGVMVGSVGYGFDADNINSRGLLAFMEKYATDDIGRITKCCEDMGIGQLQERCAVYCRDSLQAYLRGLVRKFL